jgi:ADYC domain-containing protein
MKQRGKAFVLVGLVGCVAIGVADQTGETEQAIGDTQGTNMQGTNMQGTNMQGTNMQGTTYDGADWQFTSLTDGVWGTNTPVDVTLDHSTLWFWRLTKTGYEQRFPDHICYWTLDKKTRNSCTTMTSPSPIAGLSLSATFYNHDQNLTWIARIRIGTSTTDPQAVSQDGTSAMFPLTGGASSCGIDHRGAPYCQNPNGCRLNCDIWLYNIYLIDPNVNGGAPASVCSSGQAVAVPGIYAHDGTRSNGDGTQLTFSCTAGTIAKCTRWGLRPWGTAIKNCVTNCTGPTPAAVSLVDLHQTCVRAAMADYCATGMSSTRAGTLIDLYDFNPTHSNEWGFIPKTRGGLVADNDAMAFVYESTFDKQNAYEIDHDRYDEAVGTTEVNSPFVNDICIAKPCANPDGGCNFEREVGPLDQNSMLMIDSTTACAHSELQIGKWQHRLCSPCTQAIAGLGSAYDHCTTDSTEGWDQTCVSAAYWCGYSAMAAPHSECVTGAALKKLATGCTAKVCATNSACCTSSWSSSCVTDANDKCYGGREHTTITQRYGFCNTPITVQSNM